MVGFTLRRKTMNSFLHSRVLASVAFIFALSFLQGCSVPTDKGEEAEADIEAAWMEGRNSARIFLNREWKDTAELRSRMREARARKAEWDSVGQHKAAAAYDSAFVSTIRTVSPKVAEKLD